MIDEKKILQVLSEQKDELALYRTRHWIARNEENLFELNSNLAQVVIGVRRSGKSTLCHKVLRDSAKQYAYANFDDDRLAGMGTEDLNTLLSCLYQLYGADIGYIFFDEIQEVPGWQLFINRLMRTGIHILITGSNAKLLSGELATHLTGRYNEIRLYPFSFAEYCIYHNIDTNRTTTKAEAERKKAFLNYINDGGFPEVQSIDNKRGYVQSLIDAILMKDIRQRFQIRDADSLRRLANSLMSDVGQVVNYKALADTLGISDKTIRKYVEYMQQAFLLQLLPKHSFKSRERITGEKAYLVDIGIENNRLYPMTGENLGWRLENIIYIELLRRCARDFTDVYYYRPTSQSKEVDFVVCKYNKAQYLIQVAYDISKKATLDRELSSLTKASKTLNCDNLILLSLTESRTINYDSHSIHIISAIDWLLDKTDG